MNKNISLIRIMKDSCDTDKGYGNNQYHTNCEDNINISES